MGRKQKMLGENFAPDLLSANTVYSRYSQFIKRKEPIFIVLILNERTNRDARASSRSSAYRQPVFRLHGQDQAETPLQRRIGLCARAEDLFTRIKMHSVTLNAMP